MRRASERAPSASFTSPPMRAAAESLRTVARSSRTGRAACLARTLGLLGKVALTAMAMPPPMIASRNLSGDTPEVVGSSPGTSRAETPDSVQNMMTPRIKSATDITRPTMSPV